MNWSNQKNVLPIGIDIDKHNYALCIVTMLLVYENNVHSIIFCQIDNPGSVNPLKNIWTSNWFRTINHL
jgi:hypothetical protein